MVNRYQPAAFQERVIHQSDSGEYVKYADYAELQKDSETLRAMMREVEIQRDKFDAMLTEAVQSLKETEIKRDALTNQLNRYSMSVGEADQRMNESRYVREALGFKADADDVSPRDLVEAIAEIGAREVDGFAKFYAEESQYLEPELMECAKVYANKLRGGGV
ncbi:hypothetical protein [Pectobacterium versatile]|uniref:hypothetical protein n=1 Tax=Pectobacterium versatile TaxID=2488639 RepID=UPI0032EF8FE4